MRISDWSSDVCSSDLATSSPDPALLQERRALRKRGALFLSGPFGERRQAHQDRVDIAAGLEPEQSPAVVDEVEFGIAPAPDQLRLALGLGEGQAHAAAHDLREDVEERLADRLRQLEIADRKSTRLNSSH